MLSLIITARQKSGGCHGRVSSTIFFFQLEARISFIRFFSTVSYHLEYRKWGSRFPVIMNEVYQGYLLPEHAEQAREELSVITAELKNLKPHQIIWDIDDLSKEPPWEVPISEEITDLANYFYHQRRS